MIAQLMAGYHVAGKTGWRPYAQADQIHELRHVHKVSVGQIADALRMSESEVEYYLEAYKYLVQEVLPHVTNGKGRDILESKWSHALEFVKSTKLGDLRKDPETRKDVAKLIVDGKIKGKEVRDLHKVLKVGKAKTALKTSGFKAAKKVLGQTDPYEPKRFQARRHGTSQPSDGVPLTSNLRIALSASESARAELPLLGMRCSWWFNSRHSSAR